MTRNSSAPRLLWGLLILVMAGVVGAWVASRWIWPRLMPQAPEAAELPSYGAVADFRLTDQFGQPFGSAELKGRTWIADFAFTRCSGPCPILTHNLAGLIDSLGADHPARYVTFTVDPEYDTPEVLKAYGDHFGADHTRWHFLTGPRPAISAVSVGSMHMAMGDPEITTLARPAGDRHEGAAEGNRAALDPLNAGPVDSTEMLNIPHSVRLVLVDKAMEIRGYYDGTDPEGVARLRQDLARLIRRPAS